MTTNIEIYRQRRKNLLKKIDGGVGIVFAAGEVPRNHDVCFPFRQDSNFRYLTGFNEPEAILVLCSRNPKAESVLFVRPKDPRLEMWEGRRPGPEGARELTGVDCTYNLEDFEKVLTQLLPGHDGLYFDIHSPVHRDRLAPTMIPPAKERRRKVTRPEKMQNIVPLLGGLRLSKSAEEIASMRESARISSLAHRGAMAFANSGSSEAQVQAFMEYLMYREGGEGMAYPSIVASGANALILHYRENDAPLKKGDLLLIDAGCELDGYASDITRTFPVDGGFSGPQGAMYDVVLSSQKRAIEASQVGKTLEDIHREALIPVVDWLIEEKMLTGERDQIIEDQKHKDYYVHSTGHWLGLDVHDQCPYQDSHNQPVALAPGMVFTIEPGLYFPEGDPNVPSHYRGLGIRIEDDILITEQGPENLSASTPKERAEVEEACRRDHQEFIT